MRNEISSAVDFLSKISNIQECNRKKLFKETLSDILLEHYQNHWFPEKPFKGSGYRCIRISTIKMDPLVAKAGASCGFSEANLMQILPKELTMWVDPEEVCYRIGEDGSIGVLYDGAKDNQDPDSNCNQQNSIPQLNVLQNSSRSTSVSPVPDFSRDHVSPQTCNGQMRTIFNPNLASNFYFSGMNMDYLRTYVAS